MGARHSSSWVIATRAGSAVAGGTQIRGRLPIARAGAAGAASLRAPGTGTLLPHAGHLTFLPALSSRARSFFPHSQQISTGIATSQLGAPGEGLASIRLSPA